MKVERERGNTALNRRAEEELHAVLDEAERRKEAELSRTGRKASLVICVPVLLFFAWAGAFLIWYHASEDKVSVVKPPVVQPSSPKDTSGLEAFLPDGVGGKPVSGKPATVKIVNHEDIRFAMELLNYCRPPSAWKDDAKK